MISFKIFIPVFFIPAVIMVSCSGSANSSSSAKNQKPATKATALAPCLFYKTRADYRMNVPVILSEDKSRIVSYPDVIDIRNQGAAVYPTILADGYLLDNRGIGPTVAFLSYTYDDYSKLKKTPSLNELMNSIIDKDPVTVMYRCGTRNNGANFIQELERAIQTGKMEGYTRLK